VLDEAVKLAAVEAKVAGARAARAVATGDRTLLLKPDSVARGGQERPSRLITRMPSLCPDA
jgi:hypothetical protein